MRKSPKNRRGTAQDGHSVSIFALPPVPRYGGRAPERLCVISGAQKWSGFPRFLPGHWALGLQKLPLVRFHYCAWLCRANAPGANSAPPKPSPWGGRWHGEAVTDEGAGVGPLVGAAPCGHPSQTSHYQEGSGTAAGEGATPHADRVETPADNRQTLDSVHKSGQTSPAW